MIFGGGQFLGADVATGSFESEPVGEGEEELGVFETVLADGYVALALQSGGSAFFLRVRFEVVCGLAGV